MVGKFPTDEEAEQYQIPSDVPAFLPVDPDEAPKYNDRMLQKIIENR